MKLLKPTPSYQPKPPTFPLETMLPTSSHKPPYDPPSFEQLASSDPSFRSFVHRNKNGSAHIDFTDQAATRALTRATLKRDFGLDVQIPEDRICPGVQGRLQYVRWVERLLESTWPIDWPRTSAGEEDDEDEVDDEDEDEDEDEPSLRREQVWGMDVGAGALPIYPLLAARSNPSWRILCTEIDEHSTTSARANIHRNDLDTRIRLLHTRPEDPFFRPLASAPPFAFSMCNPPFYASATEYRSSAARKALKPPSGGLHTEPGGGASVQEMVCEGGEVAFVTRMVRESAVEGIRDRCRWFTSLVGKLGSVEAVVGEVRGVGCGNWAVAEIVAEGYRGEGVERRGGGDGEGEGGAVVGRARQRTKRWAVGWSFLPFRPPVEVARGVGTGSALDKRLLPFPSVVQFLLPDSEEDEWRKRVRDTLRELHGPAVRFGVRGARCWLVCERDVWSRAARRKAKNSSDRPSSKQAVILLGAIMTLEEQNMMSIHWRQGVDQSSFESFSSFMKRKMTT